MKYTIIILTLLAIFSLQAKDTFIYKENQYQKDNFDYEIVEKYTFDDVPNRVFFTKPNLKNSGTLSMTREINRSEKGKISNLHVFETISDVNVRTVEDSRIKKISSYGEYYLISSFSEKRVSNEYSGFSYQLVTAKGEDLWKMNSNERLSSSNISDNGGVIFSTEEGRYFRKSKNGFEQKLVDAVFNQDSIENHDPMALQDFSISTDNFSLIFCAEGHDSENLKCYTYPSGAHVSIFDAVSKEVLSENLSTNILTGITRISHNQKFVVFTIGYNTTTIIDIEKKKLFKFENNEGYHRKFSPSDDLLLIDSDIIDLKNMNIVKSIITGSHVAIANKEFPIIAFMQARMLYVLNYETEEILFRDSFEGKFNGGCKLIQISGDGKYVSVIFRNEYRKYMIGGRSE